MTIGTQLDDLRAAVPGCSVAVFADLTTGLVLASSAARKVSQERLDHLCACGEVSLKGPLSEAVGLTVMNRKRDGIQYAMSITKAGFDVFVESPSSGGEALCLVCTPQVDLQHLIRHAQTLLVNLDALH